MKLVLVLWTLVVLSLASLHFLNQEIKGKAIFITITSSYDRDNK